nr:DNA methyltransferase [uncultured Draconibacterium sp.]
MSKPTINRHLIDCQEFMKDIPDNFYDLAIVDPQYGIGAHGMKMGSHPTRTQNGYPADSVAVKVRKKAKNRLNSGSGKLKNRILNQSDCSWDAEPPSPEYFKELFRVSKNKIIWGGNYFDLPPTRCIVVWDKVQPWENFSQVEIAWTSFDYPAKIFRHSNKGGDNAKRLEKIHETEKPVELYEFCLNKFANPGFKILDTHGGSFSHAFACYKLGFDLDICEIDPHKYEVAEERFQNFLKAQEEIQQFGYAKTAISKNYPTLNFE